MIRLRPVTSRLVARLSRRTLADQAESTEIISPAFSFPNSRTIALPDERERITGHTPGTPPETNWAKLDSPVFHQGATRAHLLREIVIADGTLMSNTAYAVFRAQPRNVILPTDLPAIDEAAFCSTSVTEQYFGHWLTDSLTSEMLAGDQHWRALVLAGPESSHQAEYRTAAGLLSERVALAQVNRLWLLDDCELNANRIARLKRLRDKFRGDAIRRSRNVYISRGTWGVGRVMVNEADVIAALASRGFDVLFPEQTSAADIVERLRSAQMVVGVEGSAIAHAIVAAPADAGLMVIQPPRHFQMVHKIYSAAIGMTFAYTVGDAISAETFSQPVDRLNRAIDLLDQALG